VCELTGYACTRASFRTSPVGRVIFIPLLRDPNNYNNEPLVINQIDAIGTAMHTRLLVQGKGGLISRSGAPYLTWFNGSVRTIGHFHNQIGIPNEIIGRPMPMGIPFGPTNRLNRQDQ
jgi:hypothetical protein